MGRVAGLILSNSLNGGEVLETSIDSKEVRWSLRFLMVALLGLASLVPLLFVGGVSNERQNYYNQAQQEVAQSWGQAQLLAGPLLVVPVDYPQPKAENDWQRASNQKPVEASRRHLILLPERLDIDSKLAHELRQRSIYQIPLFEAELTITGEFRNLYERVLAAVPGAEVRWQAARLVVGISDPRAIRLGVDAANNSVRWNDVDYELSTGTFDAIIGSSVEAAVPFDAQSSTDPGAISSFSLRLRLGGTDRFAVAAIGGQTLFDLRSDWPHPSFDGQHSPINRQIDENGFTANWQVHGLARNLPGLWVHEVQSRSLWNQLMGVTLYNPVTVYTTIDRGIKYGMLFIALTFLTYLCFELTAGVRFHFVQYGVVSAGLVLFYMTLLAVSEHLAFGLSYSLSTVLIVAMLGVYTWAMTRAPAITAVLVAVLFALYTGLYVLLQLEDLALLSGTAMLLVGLGALMFATRSLNRSEVGPG